VTGPAVSVEHVEVRREAKDAGAAPQVAESRDDRLANIVEEHDAVPPWLVSVAEGYGGPMSQLVLSVFHKRFSPAPTATTRLGDGS